VAFGFNTHQYDVDDVISHSETEVVEVDRTDLLVVIKGTGDEVWVNFRRVKVLQ